MIIESRSSSSPHINKHLLPLSFSVLLTMGLAALFSSMLTYSGTAISFLRLPGMGNNMGTFAETMLLAATLFAALFAALALSKRSISTPILAAIAGVLYLGSSLAFGFVGYFDYQDAFVYVYLGVATALSDVCLVLVWGRLCSKLLPIRPALVTVGLASVLSAGICHLYSQLTPEYALALFFLSAAIAVVVPLALQSSLAGRHGSNPKQPLSCNDVEAPDAPGGPAGVMQPETTHSSEAATRQILASLVDVVLAPGLGLITFAFVMAVMRTAFNEGQGAYLSMMTMASLGIVLYAALKKGRFLLPGALQLTFLPVAAMVLLAIIAITATVAAGEPVASWATYGLYSFAAVLTLATLCAVGHAGEFPSDLVFSVALFAFCGMSFVGQTVAPLLGDELISVAVTVSTTLYAFALVLVSYLRRGTERDAERAAVGAEAEEPRNPAGNATEGDNARGNHALVVKAPSLEERCARVAEAHGLTAREREILLYLAEGHNGSYIASALFISPNTARTHIHNIYRKLDVSSREDVLRLTR